MFRECYFEYAGVFSQQYNLILGYINNSNEDFDSGGKFDLKTDTLPRSHETLLYGRDFSANPLEFEVEIVNPDDYIPLEQMIEIKNWLFDQDGWKTFRLNDERQGYHLKCIFEPGEDIVDGMGYRGLRCTLHNVSPFWYGDMITTSFANAYLMDESRLHTFDDDPYTTFDIVLTEEMVNTDVFPIITIDITNTEDISGASSSITIYNTDSTVIDPSSELNKTSQIAFGAGYLFDIEGDTDDTVIINTRYATIYSSEVLHKYLQPAISHVDLNVNHRLPPSFRLHKGHNIIRLQNPEICTNIRFEYCLPYRLGAF